MRTAGTAASNAHSAFNHGVGKRRLVHDGAAMLAEDDALAMVGVYVDESRSIIHDLFDNGHVVASSTITNMLRSTVQYASRSRMPRSDPPASRSACAACDLMVSYRPLLITTTAPAQRHRLARALTPNATSGGVPRLAERSLTYLYTRQIRSCM